MLSVNCPQCSARYTMSEELYHRKGGGLAVVITCRRCKSEIRFDAATAASEKTKPSNEIPLMDTPISSSPIESKAEPPLLKEDGGEEAGPFVALSSGFFGASMGGALMPTESSPAFPEEDSTLETAVDPLTTKPPEVAPQPAKEAELVAPAHGADDSDPPESASMPVDSSELLGDDQVMSVRGSEMLDQTETVPLVINKSESRANEASARDDAGTKRKPVPAPPRRKEASVEEEEEEEEEAPASSSGTPTLMTLMGASSSQRPGARKNRLDEEFLLGLGGGPSISLQPPTIDLTSLTPPTAPASSAPESERAPESVPLSSRAPHKKKKKRKSGGRTTSSSPSHKDAEVTSSKPARRTASAPVQKEPEKKTSPLVWLAGLAIVGGLGIYFLRSEPKPVEPERAQAPLEQPVAPATVAAVVAPTPIATTAAPTDKAAPTATPPAPQAAGAVKANENNKPSGEASSATTQTKPAEAEAKPAEAEAKPAESSAGPAAEAPPTEAAAAPAGPFQPDAAKSALAAAAAQAAGCRKGDDPTGSATVIITFAPSGRVTSANVNGPPFAGTATGGCIAAAMRKAKVPAFDGERITVSKTVVIQ